MDTNVLALNDGKYVARYLNLNEEEKKVAALLNGKILASFIGIHTMCCIMYLHKFGTDEALSLKQADKGSLIYLSNKFTR